MFLVFTVLLIYLVVLLCSWCLWYCCRSSENVCARVSSLYQHKGVKAGAGQLFSYWWMQQKQSLAVVVVNWSKCSPSTTQVRRYEFKCHWSLQFLLGGHQLKDINTCVSLHLYFPIWSADLLLFNSLKHYNSSHSAWHHLLCSSSFPHNMIFSYDQCDQIWQFFGLWATF